ncbi:hypothetical protein GCM10017782_05580 [Deinococcus ficus]|nr:hypothetical protein GCM10017782_05580 [Deinococcus ficus]
MIPGVLQSAVQVRNGGAGAAAGAGVVDQRGRLSGRGHAGLRLARRAGPGGTSEQDNAAPGQRRGVKKGEVRVWA